jgi:predicted Rossmann-fold nucleotide-binding protein
MKEAVSGQGMRMSRTFVGVAGAGLATDALRTIARQCLVLANGGEGGVMQEAYKGTSDAERLA